MKISTMPTKEFFIDMLTKDIKISDSILDLIDNSIDAAKNSKSLEKKRIEIEFNENRFAIKDNCGGFNSQIAKDYAFRFGRPNDVTPVGEYSIGRFGIGMKRTLFKLGKKFKVESKCGTEYFSVSVDVMNWAENPDDWNFEIESNEYNGEEYGTYIEITELTGIAKMEFSNSNCVNCQLNLLKQVEFSYANVLKEGLKIVINGTEAEPKYIDLYFDKEIKPAYSKFELDEVEVEIYSGISESSPEKAGWYIFCNDRLLLSADKSSNTGWGLILQGNKTPKYHNDFAMFRGVIYMNSRNVQKLPLTTTKVGIDFDSIIYKKIASIINYNSRRVFELLKNVKNDKEFKDYINNVSRKESIFDIKGLWKDTSQNEFLFNYSINDYSSTKSEVNISYTRPTKEVELVKQYFNITSAKDVGIKTFEYFIEMEEI